MARTMTEIPFAGSPAEAQSRVEAILKGRGYHPHTLKSGENVWKNGVGLLTAMKYLKVEYAENAVLLSGWVQMGLGDAGLNEMALDGVVGIIPKKQVKNVIEEIGKAL